MLFLLVKQYLLITVQILAAETVKLFIKPAAGNSIILPPRKIKFYKVQSIKLLHNEKQQKAG